MPTFTNNAGAIVGNSFRGVKQNIRRGRIRDVKQIIVTYPNGNKYRYDVAVSGFTSPKTKTSATNVAFIPEGQHQKAPTPKQVKRR